MENKNGKKTLVFGGYKFLGMRNLDNSMLVVSVDPEDTTTSVVIASGDSNSCGGGIENRIKKLNSHQLGKDETKMETKALLFCKLVNKILRKRNSSCFVGYEVIHKMISKGLGRTRADALVLGRELSKKFQLFYRVDLETYTFSDDDKLYKFRPEVLISIILGTPMSIKTYTGSDKEASNAVSSYRKAPHSPTKHKKSTTFPGKQKDIGMCKPKKPTKMKPARKKSDARSSKRNDPMRTPSPDEWRKPKSKPEPMPKPERKAKLKRVTTRTVPLDRSTFRCVEIPKEDCDTNSESMCHVYGDCYCEKCFSVALQWDIQEWTLDKITAVDTFHFVDEHIESMLPTKLHEDDEESSYMEVTVSSVEEEEPSIGTFEDCPLSDEDCCDVKKFEYSESDTDCELVNVLAAPATPHHIDPEPEGVPKPPSPTDVMNFDDASDSKSSSGGRQRSLSPGHNKMIQKGDFGIGIEIPYPDQGEDSTIASSTYWNDDSSIRSSALDPIQTLEMAHQHLQELQKFMDDTTREMPIAD